MVKVKRQVRKPVLIYCEGLHDAVFMNYLHRLYGSQNKKVRFTIKQGGGGSPISLVTKALNVIGAYELRLVKFDNDRGQKELDQALAAINKAQKQGIQITAQYCTPCLEATLLSILNPGKDYSLQRTENCKRDFHNNHIQESERTRIGRYEQKFPRDVLESARVSVSALNEMIRQFEIS